MRSILALAFIATWLGCSNHSHEGGDAGQGGHSSAHPSCDAIIKACHPLDTGAGAIHDCHDLGHDHDATEASCAAKKGECLALCVADAGARDAAAD